MLINLADINQSSPEIQNKDLKNLDDLELDKTREEPYESPYNNLPDVKGSNVKILF
jgi:hypothetical protein